MAGGKGNAQCILRSKRSNSPHVFECETVFRVHYRCRNKTIIMHFHFNNTADQTFPLKFAVVIRRDGMQGVSETKFFLSQIVSRDELLFDSMSNTAKCSTLPEPPPSFLQSLPSA